MRRNLFIAIIIALVILILVGGGIAFAYFFTDIFKSNKELFFKYIAKNSEITSYFEQDESIKKYIEKQETTGYITQGNLKLLDNFGIENIESTNISFTGSTDKLSKYTYRNVKLNYSDTENLSMEYVNMGDYYGIKIQDVLDYFLAFDNNNLQEFARKLGLSEEIIAKIPNKIEAERYEYTNLFTEEEKQTLKQKYFEIINSNLTDEMFSKSKTSDTNIYTFTLTPDTARTILTKILNAVKEDELIIEKFKKIMINDAKMSDDEASGYITEAKELIDNLINDLNGNETEYSESKVEEKQPVHINVYVNNKKLIKTEFEAYNTKIAIVNTENGFNVELSQDQSKGAVMFEKAASADIVKYLVTVQYNDQRIGYLEINFSGLTELTNVVESFEFNIDVPESDYKLGYKYTENKKFVDSLVKENVTVDDMLFINSAPSAETISNLLSQTISKLQEVNTNKLNNAGFSGQEFAVYLPAIIPYYVTQLLSGSINAKNEALPTGTVTAGVVTAMSITVYNQARETINSAEDSILEQAVKARYETTIASIKEQVSLAQMSLIAKMASQESNFEELVKDVAIDLNATNDNFNSEGFSVKGYLDKTGNNTNENYGYILITYTDDSVRANINAQNISNYSSLNFKIAGENAGSTNNTVIAYVIRVENYNAKLSNPILTDITTLTGTDGKSGDWAKTKFSDTVVKTGIDSTLYNWFE